MLKTIHAPPSSSWHFRVAAREFRERSARSRPRKPPMFDWLSVYHLIAECEEWWMVRADCNGMLMAEPETFMTSMRWWCRWRVSAFPPLPLQSSPPSRPVNSAHSALWSRDQRRSSAPSISTRRVTDTRHHGQGCRFAMKRLLLTVFLYNTAHCLTELCNLFVKYGGFN